MSNSILKEVYKNVFEKDFDSSKFEERLKMQKMVYLLQNMGISIGDYNFLWYKHGPYSQVLQNDILSEEDIKPIDLKYSNDAKKEIDKLKKAMAEENLHYSQAEWIECLGSLLYIKENVLSSSSNEDDIIKELKKRKPHLDNDTDNKKAFSILDGLIA